MVFSSSVIDIIQCATVVLGVIVTLQQWWEHKKLQKIKYLEKYSKEIMRDEIIADFIFKIEHELTFGCKGGIFTDKEDERKADYVLTCLLNYVVLKKKNLIGCADFYFFNYVLKRTLENDEINAYFNLLQNVSQSENITHPYQQLVEYGKENGFLL